MTTVTRVYGGYNYSDWGLKTQFKRRGTTVSDGSVDNMGWLHQLEKMIRYIIIGFHHELRNIYWVHH